MLVPQMDEIARNADGTFAVGHKPIQRVYQPYGDRVMELRERYSIEELKAIVDDEKALGKFSVRDGQIIIRLANSIWGKPENTRLEAESLLDREEGKAIARVDTRTEGKFTLSWEK